MRKITFFKTLLIAIALVVGSISASAQLLVEDFNYTVGTVLTATTTADPVTGWLSHSGAGTANIDVVAGLSFTGYAGSGIGGAANVDNTGEDINKTFTSQTSGVIYVAFMLQTSTPNSAGYFFMLSADPVSTTFNSRIFVNATGDGIGLSASSTAPSTFVTITPGTTVLVVIKHNFTLNTTDLFVLNSFAATEPSSASQSISETYATTGAVVIRQYNASQRQIIDGIRVGTVWSDAVAAPGNPKTATPTFSATPGNVITPQSVTLSCTTAGASIYYTLDGTTPNNTGNGTLFDGITPIAVSSTTTIKAIAYASGMDASSLATGIYTFPTEVANLATLRGSSTSGFYKLTGEVLLTFQSVAGKAKYIQDATAGIVIYDGSGKITTSYNIGDKISNIYCTLSMYNGMYELIPFADPGVANSSGNAITPVITTLIHLAAYQGQLVTVKNVAITGTGNFVSAIAYPISDGTARVLRTAYSDLPYIGSPIPSTNQNITGVVNMYSISEADLIPRTIADFINSLPVPSGINATLIAPVGFTANWTAVANASSYDVKVYDGTLTLINTVNVTGATTATAAITGLTQSTAYTFTVTAKGDGINFGDSPESESIAINTISSTLATPTVGTASRVTLTTFTANWTAVPNATSYDINAYDASNALVTGFPKNVTGATTQTLAITSSGGVLLPNNTYTFTVTAKGDNVTYFNSLESAKSTPFTTATSGSFVMQYPAADAMIMNAEIKSGAADIYELTESGGIYTFSTTLSDNNSIVRSCTIRAAAGLAAKPIIKLTTTSTSGTADIFNAQIANITVNLNGLEFDGRNSASGGTQPILFYAKGTSATNFKIYVTNCLIHDFYNASGNGLIRLDGITAAAPTGVIDIQGSTIYNFSARALYLNPANNVTNAYTVNLKNNTFYANSVLSSRANIIYSAGGSGYWSGSITIDHCTFNNIVTTSTSEGIIRQLTPATAGSITITNSIFTSVGQTLYAYISANYCYLAGFATLPTGATATPVTNTFAASPAPAYTDPTTYNFRLTNASSFICADGFVAGNTYNSLASPSVLAGGTDITSSGFTANWTAVANASSYDVKVYDATPAQVGSTINVAVGTLSLVVTGLNSNASYTYTVTAKGDNVTYFDSPAATSASVSTLVTGLNRTETGIAVWVNNKEIICAETGSMEVYNLQGAKVLQAQNVNKVNTNLASGLYLVKFIGTNGQISNLKVIIK